MPISNKLKHKLSGNIFTETGSQGAYSYNVFTAPSSSADFYYGKPTPFIYNHDLANGLGLSVHYTLQPGNNISFTLEEAQELDSYFTSDYKWELRIVTHNQRSTHRRKHTHGMEGHYPCWQSATASTITPYDLNDVGTMLGYRGNDLVNYNNSWPTGIISYDSTKHTAPYYLNNGLAGQAGHHPKANAGHPHPIYSINYAGWGRAAIINKYGNTRFGSSSFKQNLDNVQKPYVLASGTGTSTISWRSHIDLQYAGITDGYITCSPYQMSLHVKIPYYGGGSAPYCMGFNDFGTYKYKVDLAKTDLLNGKTGEIPFPIVAKAAKTLYSRKSTTYNTQIPDCYDYTVALVIWKRSTHHWKVFDIIFDRLRTIDRWDLERINTNSYITLDGGLEQFAHPSYDIICADAAWSAVGSNKFVATFSRVPFEWWNKNFTNAGSTTGLGLDYYAKGGTNNWAMNNTFIGACYEVGTSGYQLAIMPIGNGAGYGDIINSWPWEYGSISAAYSTGSESLTVCFTVQSSGRKMHNFDAPALFLRHGHN